MLNVKISLFVWKDKCLLFTFITNNVNDVCIYELDNDIKVPEDFLLNNIEKVHTDVGHQNTLQ